MTGAAAVLLDFDHTVFDTDRFFWVALRAELAKAGIDGRLWEETYERVWPGGYTLMKHLKAVAAAAGVRASRDAALKGAALNLLTRAPEWVYPDVAPFLKKCEKAGMDRYLLTFGAPSWQRQKISASRLQPLFNEVLFAGTEAEKRAWAQRIAAEAGTLLFVDNDPRFLDEVARIVPSAKTCWISRIPPSLRANGNTAPPDEYREALTYATMMPVREHVRIGSLREIRLPKAGGKSKA